jgi:hypothetical protein
MSQENVILCARVGTVSDVVYGVSKGKCSDCGCEIWMAPSSITLTQADPNIKPCCQFCVQTRIAADPDVLFAVTPEAVKEANAYMKRVHTN